MFRKMMQKQRNRRIITSSLLVFVLFFAWFFSHPLTPEQALKESSSNYAEIVARYSVDQDEVFIVKSDHEYSSQVIQRKGFFYEPKSFSSNHSLVRTPDLRASYHTSFDERTEITTTIVIAWEDVDYVQFNHEFLDKTEYDGYTLFYGYVQGYVQEQPTLYDEKFNEIEYYTSQR